MINFLIEAEGPVSALFQSKGIEDFQQACAYVQVLPYGRNTDRNDFTLVLTEGKGSCSGKHALLAQLAEEHGETRVELIAGIFMMSPETHPVLTATFQDKPYTAIPECHCYLRVAGRRFDYTAFGDGMERIASKIVREQRIEPHQVVDWKPKMHRHFMESWLKRQLQLTISFEELWNDREECIRLMSVRND